MLRRSLFLIGFPLLLIAETALADCPVSDPLVGLDPVSSHYTERILERSGAALSRAAGEPGAGFSKAFFDGWELNVRDALVKFVDTDLHYAERARSLHGVSACLHVDLRLLEAEIEKTRCEVQSAFARGSANALNQLFELHSFLHERYRALLRGAADPFYEDRGWTQERIFDEPTEGWCCITHSPDPTNNFTCQELSTGDCWQAGGERIFKTAESCITSELGCKRLTIDEPDLPDERLCPFHSDYLPPTSTGYGCDLDALDPYSGIEPFASEHEGLTKFIDARDTFIEQSQPVQDLIRQIDELMGRPPRPGLPDPDEDLPEHNVFVGCGEGLLEQWDLLPEEPINEDDQKRTETNVLYQTGATAGILRGPFSFEQHHGNVLFDLARRRLRWEEEREYPDYMKFPSEYIPNSSSSFPSGYEERPYDFFFRMEIDSQRDSLDETSGRQALLETRVIPKAIDMPAEITRSLISVRQGTQSLVKATSDNDEGARGMVRNLAWFLRRSCVYRPCNARLERVLKIVLTDSCFPYTRNGDLSDPQRQRTCEQDADFDLPTREETGGGDGGDTGSRL